MLKKIPADYFDSAKGTLKLLWEQEWRSLGITQVSSERGFVDDDDRNDVLFHLSTVFYCFQIPKSQSNHHWQSLGWEHYEVHEPEPHILLFK